MDANLPYLHFEQLLRLLESCQNGHDCENEKELINLAIAISLSWIKDNKNDKLSQYLIEMHDKFTNFKHLNELKCLLKKSKPISLLEKHDQSKSLELDLNPLVKLLHETPMFVSKKLKQKKPKRTNIKSLCLHVNLIGWGLSPGKLEVFFSKLNRFAWIKGTYKEFESHFYETNQPTNQIIWLKSVRLLARLFYRLRERDVIPREYVKAKLLELHFCDSNGNSFTNASLRSNPGSPMNSQIEKVIDDLIDELHEI